MTKENIDINKIKELIDIMKENDLVEIEIAQGDEKVCLKRTQPQPGTFTAGSMIQAQPFPTEGLHTSSTEPMQQHPPTQDDGLININSPIVGTFYRAASPDAESFVDIGSPIEDNSIVCIIEAMKVMNEIKAEVSGTIAEILVSNGQAVEYGQLLFKVKPN